MNESFIINENRLFAPVRVGQDHGYAHIDTGARHSSILQAYSSQCSPIGSRDVHGAFGKASIPQVRLEEMTFLGEMYRNMTVDVQPDSQGGLDSLPFAVIMALGCDILLQKPLFLNFEECEMGCWKGDISKAAGVILETNFTQGLPIFKVSCGEHVLNAVFDTAGGMSVLNQRLFSTLQEELIEEDPVEVEDATGVKHTIPVFRCNRLAVSGRLLGDCQLLVIDLGAVEQQNDLQLDFVFGINAMLGKRWVVDSHDGVIVMI